MDQDSLLKIYNLIADLQEKIGGVEITLTVKDEYLKIRIYFPHNNYCVHRAFTKYALIHTDNIRMTDALVCLCKKHHQ